MKFYFQNFSETNNNVDAINVSSQFCFSFSILPFFPYCTYLFSCFAMWFLKYSNQSINLLNVNSAKEVGRSADSFFWPNGANEPAAATLNQDV